LLEYAAHYPDPGRAGFFLVTKQSKTRLHHPA
jgi:hypothetical protein